MSDYTKVPRYDREKVKPKVVNEVFCWNCEAWKDVDTLDPNIYGTMGFCLECQQVLVRYAPGASK